MYGLGRIRWFCGGSIIEDNAVIAAGSVIKGHIKASSVYFQKHDVHYKSFERSWNNRGLSEKG